MPGKTRSILAYLLVAVIGVGVGLGISNTGGGQKLAAGIKAGAGSASSAVLEKVVSSSSSLGTRELLLFENPSLIKAIKEGGAFGGEFSQAAAEDMFGRYNEKAIADVSKLSKIVEVAPGTWMIYLPIVNAVLFETEAGLVLVDTGMAPAGPAIMELIRSVSDKPLHTIIYTHGHVDHAYGTWALMEDNPQVVGHNRVAKRF